MSHTLTYWFSTIFLPLSLKTHAWVSKSMFSTLIVNVVRTRVLLVLPVELSVWTFRIVDPQTQSPSDMRLYACHMSSGFSGTKTTLLRFKILLFNFILMVFGNFFISKNSTCGNLKKYFFFYLICYFTAIKLL